MKALLSGEWHYYKLFSRTHRPQAEGQCCPYYEELPEDIKEEVEGKAGVNGIQQSPKIFRSTFASMALAAGCDFYIVKRLLRHSGGWDVTHRHYIHIGNQELMKRLEKYSPLRLLNENSDKLRDKPKMI